MIWYIHYQEILYNNNNVIDYQSVNNVFRITLSGIICNNELYNNLHRSSLSGYVTRVLGM